jgi:hypothetical protein
MPIKNGKNFPIVRYRRKIPTSYLEKIRVSESSGNVTYILSSSLPADFKYPLSQINGKMLIHSRSCKIQTEYKFEANRSV